MAESEIVFHDAELVRRQPSLFWGTVAVVFSGPLNLFGVMYMLADPERKDMFAGFLGDPSVIGWVLSPLSVCGAISGALLLAICGRRTNINPILWFAPLIGAVLAALYLPAVALFHQVYFGDEIEWRQLLLQDSAAMVFLGSWVWGPMAFSATLAARIFAYRRA